MLKIYNSNKFSFKEIDDLILPEESAEYESSMKKYNEMRQANAEDIAGQILKDFKHYDRKAVLGEILESFDATGRADSFELKY